MKNMTLFFNQKRALFCLLLTLATFSYSQDSTPTTNTFWKNVQFGGNIGLGLGNGFFSGALSPNAVYRFNPYVATGAGLNFQYSSSERDNFKSTVYGASILGLFNPYEDIQISTEFEQLRVKRSFDQSATSTIDESYWYPALFLGAGYRTGNVTIGIRYDVLYDEDKSIQNQAWMPFIRFWF